MPPPLPDRFDLEVRLGRDGDIEEWLATDVSLDRPVLIRFLGPETTEERRREFATAVRAASKIGHPHLASVYLVAEAEDSAYSVSEWTGGATLESRLDAGDTIDPEEFLPNAAGLAAALAALHDSGVVHGGIDLGAITYTVAHPAKLGAFGRRSRGATSHDDVRSLSEALEEGLTGAPPGMSPPSEMIDGLSPRVDEILRSGRRNALAARGLSEAFTGAPTPRRPQPESTRPSRRLLLVAVGLVLAAAGLIGLGRVFTFDAMPVAPPPEATPDTGPLVEPDATTPPLTSTTTTVATSADLTVSSAATFDPFGEGGENDDLVGNLLDGDSTTSWRTESYLDPLPLLKSGVGVTVQVEGTPHLLELAGLAGGASIEVRWSSAGGDQLDSFEVVGRLTSQPGISSIRLPSRSGGMWLVWFTDLPAEGDHFVAEISELRMVP